MDDYYLFLDKTLYLINETGFSKFNPGKSAKYGIVFSAIKLENTATLLHCPPTVTNLQKILVPNISYLEQTTLHCILSQICFDT